VNRLTTGSHILDVGCGFGRITRQLAQSGMQVTGIDINAKEIALAQVDQSDQSNRVNYLIMSATDMSGLSSASFDACLLMGTLGGVNANDRHLILDQTHQLLRPGGLIYIAELARKYGDPVREDRYQRDFDITGEMGSRVVFEQPGETGQVLYIAKHFDPNEVKQLLQTHGFREVEIKTHEIFKQGIIDPGVEKRQQISAWGIV
jgi:2-polyprenyl-3-methyl-5-hydroxy-6-metoxy-1,4-benzoquinol methylase